MRRRQPATASRTTVLVVILRILRRLHHAPASHTSWITRAPTSCRVRRWRRGEPRADGTWRLWKIWDGLRDRIDVAARRGGRCTADIYGREGAVSGLYCRPWQHGLTTASIDQPKRKFARCGRRGGGWIRRHVIVIIEDCQIRKVCTLLIVAGRPLRTQTWTWTCWLSRMPSSGPFQRAGLKRLCSPFSLPPTPSPSSMHLGSVLTLIPLDCTDTMPLGRILTF